MNKLEIDLFVLIGGILSFLYGYYANREWLLYDSRKPPIIFGILLILIGILDFIFG